MSALFEIDIDDLPQGVRSLVEIVGLPAALKLVERYGGTMGLYIPARLAPEHPLVQLIGPDAAAALSRDRSGETIDVPLASRALRAVRNREIRRRHAAGESCGALAREFRMTERQMFNIVADGVRQADEQPELF